MNNENRRGGDIPDDYLPQIRRPSAARNAQSQPSPSPRVSAATNNARGVNSVSSAYSQNVQRPRATQSSATSSVAGAAASTQKSTSQSRAVSYGANKEAKPTVRRVVSQQNGNNASKGTKYRSAIADKSSETRSIDRKALKQAENYVKSARTPKDAGSGNGGSAVMSMIKAMIYIVVVVAVAGLLSYYVIVFANDMYAFVKSSEEVEVTIPEYATVEEIADVLGEAGVVKYPGLLVLYAKLKNIDKTYEFVAGNYTVNGMMNYDELFYAFVPHKSYEVVRITIPEGYTIEEMITLFTSNGIGTREGFIDAINNYDFNYDFVKALDESGLEGRIYRLEGYLYPDTYEFYKSSSEVTVINKMLKRFNRIFSQDFYDRAVELGYTVDEIITLASLIEKEARYAQDYEIVSSVFHNRLNNSSRYPCLESDATIMYAIQIRDGERKTSLSGEDLQYDTPYNSYLYPGLTPGPIANPGYEAITCALYPAESKYYYFVSDNYGNTYFAKTNDEHNRNKAKVAQINEGS
ncbi:MAG: endolytic transglycosylase MltG [Clostridia bacterium]|nr:endolytic transglycosylase MltG [Clostridia bacterium]